MATSKHKTEKYPYGLEIQIYGGPKRQVWFDSEIARKKAMIRWHKVPNTQCKKLS